MSIYVGEALQHVIGDIYAPVTVLVFVIYGVAVAVAVI